MSIAAPNLPKVWSERQPGAWTDCTYSAVLMVLVGSGFDRYPLGMYANAERDALEAADDRADGKGATFRDTDLAVLRRYGLHIPRIANGSVAGLRDALSRPGRAYAVAGMNREISEHLRRWSPRFEGAHAVCVVPLGGGQVLWLDPLAPMAYPGERVDVEAVLRWAFIPSDARYLELARPTTPAKPVPPPPPKETDDMGLVDHKHQIPKLVRIPAGITLRQLPSKTAAPHRQVGSSDKVVNPFEAEILAVGAWPFLLARRRGGDGGFYVSAADLPRSAWLGNAMWPDEVAALIRGLKPNAELQELVDELESRIAAGMEALQGDTP